jgi:hypothetical protein
MAKPLPIILQTVSYKKVHRPQLSFIFSLKSPKGSRTSSDHSAQSPFHNAANSKDLHVVGCSLVKEYISFEQDSTMHQDGLPQQDARGVCWILIYSILQVLMSATRAPEEIRDTNGTKYHLFVNVSNVYPWTDESHAKLDPPVSNYAQKK